MADVQWARLQSDVDCPLRRGAWSRVADVTEGEAQLDVNRRRVSVPRLSLKIVSNPPQAWCIVPLPRDAKGLPTMWGDKYVVCPGCRNRAPLKGAPPSMRCPRCRDRFRIAWEEWFIGRRDAEVTPAAPQAS